MALRIGRSVAAGLLLAAALLTWPGGVAAASQPVATVVWTSGEVLWLPQAGGAWEPLAAGALLAPGDQIRTGASGRAELAYQVEAARLWIEPRTHVTLGSAYETALRAVTAGDVRLAGDLPPFRAAFVWIGSVWAEVRAGLSRLWRFEVETPTAVAGVRGTRFLLSVTPAGETRLYVAQGVVELRSRLRRVLVPAGQAANVLAREPASGPGGPQGPPDEWDEDLWEGEDDGEAFRREGEDEPEFLSDLEDLVEASEDARVRWLETVRPLVEAELARNHGLRRYLIEEVREADDGESSGLLAWLLALDARVAAGEWGSSAAGQGDPAPEDGPRGDEGDDRGDSDDEDDSDDDRGTPRGRGGDDAGSDSGGSRPSRTGENAQGDDDGDDDPQDDEDEDDDEDDEDGPDEDSDD